MTIEQIKAELEKISVRWSEKSAAKIENKINETAEKLAPLLTEKNLIVAKGSSSPSTNKSFQSIYLEYPGASHNSSHKAYSNVLGHWEWQTKSKYGFAPVPQGEFFNVCDQLISRATAAKAFSVSE